MLLQGGEEESLLVVVVRVQRVIEEVKVLREVQCLPSLQEARRGVTSGAKRVVQLSDGNTRRDRRQEAEPLQ
jgi:hypothetical protein